MRRGGDSPPIAQMRRKRRHGYPRIGEGIGVKQAGVSRLWPRGGADAPPQNPTRHSTPCAVGQTARLCKAAGRVLPDATLADTIRQEAKWGNAIGNRK